MHWLFLVQTSFLTSQWHEFEDDYQNQNHCISPIQSKEITSEYDEDLTLTLALVSNSLERSIF